MNKIGKFGEDIACMFLMKRGYKVVERNYLKKWGELDIVARKGNRLCFIEVKTVSCEIGQNNSHIVTCGTGYRPEDNMNKAKIAKFLRIVQTYLQEKRLKNVDWSMALIAIRVDTTTKKARVRFIEDLVF